MENIEVKNKDFFWPSYVDLMTALFAIVLVLFVLSYKFSKDQEKKAIAERDKFQVRANQYERIQKIDTQIHALEKTGRFEYDEQYKRFLVKDFVGQEIFNKDEFIIRPQYINAALNAGKDIKSLISSFANIDKNVKFLILIEGNCAYGEGMNKNNDGTYVLSYRRALALYKLWQSENFFDPEKTEIIIGGSGFYGVGRDKKEENNKRFLIQIIPKINKE